MDLGITGKVAIITGGSQGIGKEIALALAREGARIAICARTEAILEEAARDIERETKSEVLPVRADVTDFGDVQRFVSETVVRFGQIDILINGANNSRSAGFFELTDQDWFNHLDVKLLGKVRVIREVAPHMMERRWGRIINIAGGASRRVRGPDGRVNSWTSGAINPGLTNLSKRLCDELGPYGITVNTVLPGGVETPGKARRRARFVAEHNGAVQTAELERETERPIGRPITAADSAHLICFVASELAGAISGQVLCVDGGATAGIYY
jgi:NAD(P)-dependent dehydrogenase (short-subunit alcohol dehydrogenase family)